MTGGGSGGHIVPLLSLARELKSVAPDCRVIYIGLKGEELSSLEKQLTVFDAVYRVRSGKLRRYHGQNLAATAADVKSLALNIRDGFKVAGGYFEARRLLRRLKPQVVMSKGGYGAVPVATAAYRLKIPLITHDSDVVPGLANRWAGRWATIHATGQPAENYRGVYPESSIRYVGIPLDERLVPVTAKLQAEYKQSLGMPTDSFVLLVTGGGLGSKTINEKIVALAADFLAGDQNRIVHFSGAKHVDSTKQAYETCLAPDQLRRVEVIGFSTELYRYSGAADLVVTRGGASTLAELAAQHKACIVIPADWLTGGHQLKNVASLEEHQAIMVADNDISPQNLLKLINRFKQNPHLRSELGQNLGSIIKFDGAKQLADLILTFCR